MWHSHRSLIIVVVIVFVFSVVLLVAYVVNFRHAPLSDRPMDWGVFGDYVGGALGTVFSFGAFVGVLYTLYHQREQNTLQKKQHEAENKQYTLNELRGFLTISTDALDAVLYMEIADVSSTVNTIDTVYALLIEKMLKVSRSPAFQPGPSFSYQAIDNYKGGVTASFGVEVDRIQREFSFVIMCLREYKEKEGNKLVITYYCTRFFDVACFLQTLRRWGYPIVIDEQLIADFFALAIDVIYECPAGANIITSAAR